MRRIAVLLAIGSLLAGLAAVTFRMVRPLQELLLPTLAASFVPYGIVGWLVAAAFTIPLAFTRQAIPSPTAERPAPS